MKYFDVLLINNKRLLFEEKLYQPTVRILFFFISYMLKTQQKKLQ